MEPPENPAEPDAPEDNGDELCLSCVSPNPPGTHFCGHCGTPLTSYAATAPFESIFAEGAFYRKAAQSDRWSRPVRYLIRGFLILILLSMVFFFFLWPLFYPWMRWGF